MADSCIYNYVRNKIRCAAVTRIPLQSRAISCCRNTTEDKLVLGCEDSSIILYDAYNQVTLLAQAKLLPALITYHPSGAIFLVGSSQGELQIFDTALSPVKIQLLADNYSPKATLQFSKHFDVSSSLIQIQWAAAQAASPSTDGIDVHDLLFVRFDKGPLGVLHFKLGKSLSTSIEPLGSQGNICTSEVLCSLKTALQINGTKTLKPHNSGDLQKVQIKEFTTFHQYLLSFLVVSDM